MTPRPLATVTVERDDAECVILLRTDAGAVMRYGPFSGDGVEAGALGARHFCCSMAVLSDGKQALLFDRFLGAPANKPGHAHKNVWPAPSASSLCEVI